MIDPTVTVSISNPTLALVSDATVFVDGEGHPGVITVQRFEEDRIEITVQPLTQLPYPLHLEIILDSTDLAHIKSLLEAQDRAAAQANPPDPSNPSDCYDCRTNHTRLDELDGNIVDAFQAIDQVRKRLVSLEEARALHNQRLNAITKRVDDLEARQEPAALAEDETLLTVDIMAAYDLIARRERSAGGA